MSLRVVGSLFLALAAYVAVDAAGALVRREAPSESVVGIVLAAPSVVVMPLPNPSSSPISSGRAPHSLFHVAARIGVVVGCAEPPLGSSVTALTAMRSPAGMGNVVSARPLESVLNVPRLTGGRPV